MIERHHSFGIDQQGGKGMAGFRQDVCPTICSDSHGTPYAVVYVVDPLKSNSMKSKNPHSGFHREHIAPCIDTSCQSPIRNGGGTIIVQRCHREPSGN